MIDLRTRLKKVIQEYVEDIDNEEALLDDLEEVVMREMEP